LTRLLAEYGDRGSGKDKGTRETRGTTWEKLNIPYSLFPIPYSLFPIPYLAKIIIIKLYKASKFVNYARFFVYCRE
jgi:hypothetical protein